MIDIKTLKQYPLSFSLLEKWVEQKHTTSLALLLDKVTNEELVEFLDSTGINIQISVKCAINNSIWFIPDVFYIDMGLDCVIPFREYESRTSATEAAIQKAFELLEQKLKVN